MPKARPTIASFWVIRDEEHPEAEARNYPGMLQVLQTSCDRLGLKHVVLTDEVTLADPRWPEGVEGWATDLPAPLMRAVTEVQARFLESGPAGDVLFVGADCIVLADPIRFYPKDPALCVTYRSAAARYPINTGAQMVREHSREAVAALFRRVADRCGTTWCDDQRAIQAELEPMPTGPGTYNRAGLMIGFLPMGRFNVVPKSVADPCIGVCMLHFRGKGRKQFFFDWARRHGFA